MTQDEIAELAARTWHLNNPHDDWSSVSNPIAKNEWKQKVRAIIDVWYLMLEERD